MTEPDPSDVALELERLHGVVETGFAHNHRRLDVLVHQSDQTDKRPDDYEQRSTVLERAP
ncbi:hypothetical protein AV521_32250 [Streptomyces sp. IMTB 2501]|uniref:hypothetical protein n=1 Tax=Streptomyces sp. IMTB 2501 TaxID=1776340 RepID=UPI00096C673F|nr:hypothetical protein [Streptomyces sp. IMTB 2501]OLZ65355.1 hypothetical protein AV521_32250 [Streptomyces sp. IMTB 2501]